MIYVPRLLKRHKEFIGHVAAMMSGRTFAAAIALFTTPIIARLFDPADFGVAAVFIAIVSLTSNVASLRYESALVLPREDGEAFVLMALCYRAVMAFSIVMLAFLAIYHLSDLSWSGVEMLGAWAWLLPLGTIILATLQIQECWLARKKEFKLVSVSLVLGNSVASGARIAFGWFAGTSIYGLIIGYLAGTVCRLMVQKTASKESLQASFGRARWAAMRRVASEYSDFPKLNAPAGLVASLGQNLPILFFGAMFSPAVAGMYAMANRLAQVPVTIGATSVRRVFLQKAAAVNNSGRSLRNAFLLVTGGLALVGIIPFLCLWLFGQPLLAGLLGERWLQAGLYLEIIAPWMLMIWITAPSNPVFVVLRRQKLWLSLHIFLTILRLGVFALAYAMGAEPAWTLRAFVNVTVVGNILIISVALMLISAASRLQRGAVKPAALNE